MPTTTAIEVQPESKPELTAEERKALLEQAIERQEKLAESQLEMARMFIAQGKVEFAQRRLRELLTKFGESAVAGDARQLLATLDAAG
jgi:thioredoxin-like negative regulator of GroEL